MSDYDPIFAERFAERARQDSEHRLAYEFRKTARAQKAEKPPSAQVNRRARRWQHVRRLLHLPGHKRIQTRPVISPRTDL